jgi:hypothetical protein
VVNALAEAAAPALSDIGLPGRGEYTRNPVS